MSKVELEYVSESQLTFLSFGNIVERERQKEALSIQSLFASHI